MTPTPADTIRARFSAAMSAMYRDEVPAYATLMDLVAAVNDRVLAADPDLNARLVATGELARISDERHGAIRLGTPAELSMMRRVFAVMGMEPVGYYDLTEANVPVHSTAFRPVDAAVALVEKAEAQGGLEDADATRFVAEVLETFRWHDRANVSADLYHRLHDAHRLVADVVSFRGPHINHLTPRTLDIDAVQAGMPAHGIAPKAVVEGPPTRRCPILLRQTSFKALDEPVAFRQGAAWVQGQHTARFGEIEQRGIALTPKGRTLYDQLLTAARKLVLPAADGSNASAYVAALAQVFAAFPDDWEAIRSQGLGYFAWSLTDTAKSGHGALTADQARALGLIRPDPITYEDFLPVSAAGIFQSNLGDDSQQAFTASPNQRRFETDLGAQVLNEFDHYAGIEAASLRACLAALV